MSNLQEKDVIALLKKRDSINTKIEVRTEQNKTIDEEVDKLLKQGKEDFGLDITLENYLDLIA